MDCRIFQGGGVLKPTCGTNCCSLRRVLSLGRVKPLKACGICGMCGFSILSHIPGGWDVETNLVRKVVLPKTSLLLRSGQSAPRGKAASSALRESRLSWRGVFHRGRALSLGRVKALKACGLGGFEDCRIFLGWQGCPLDQLLSPKKSPKPRAR